MHFTLANIIDIYHFNKLTLDICIAYIAGSLSSITYFKYFNKIKNPKWISNENIIHKNSHIIEYLYQDYINSGDCNYELYDDVIVFNKKTVKINNEQYYQKLLK